MNDRDRRCSRIEEMSALMDGALRGRARDDAQRHAAVCPACGAMLDAFRALSGDLQRLRTSPPCDVDIAALVLPQLKPHGRERRPSRWPWHLAPQGAAAAAALAAGVWLGIAVTGGGAVASRPPAMAVFDAAPPGSMCAGIPACQPGRK